MKLIIFLGFVITFILLVSISTTVFAADFTDVGQTHPYYNEINFCKLNGYIKGDTETLFRPDESLTRGQIAVILCRVGLFRFLPINVTAGSFTDIVPLQHYYDTSVIIMGSLGIIHGTSETIFSPDDIVTREQFACFVQRSAQLAGIHRDTYMVYNDHSSIYDWAVNPVNACLNADLFVGLYDGLNFEPQKPVTRAEVCKLIYNISQWSHTIMVAPMKGGDIDVSLTHANAGKLINVAVSPFGDMRLKTGTLKYNGLDIDFPSGTFIMPDEDVLITAIFEAVPKHLSSIEVTLAPSKFIYQVGETLDLSGLIVIARYAFSDTVEITGYTTIPADGSILNTPGKIEVTVNYTEGDYTKTTTFNIRVEANPG
jgi:hypothetical protein